MARPQWERIVAQAPRVGLMTVDLTDQLYEQSPIDPGGYAVAQWNPPAGYVARPLSWDVLLNSPVGASSGQYGMSILAGRYGDGLPQTAGAWIMLQAPHDLPAFALAGYRPIAMSPSGGQFTVRAPETDEAALLVMQTMQLYHDEAALIVGLVNMTDEPWVLDNRDLYYFRAQLRLEQITPATV